MADYLLVVDMQSDYVAVGKAYHEELIAAVNDKIASYPSDRVIYIPVSYTHLLACQRLATFLWPRP